MEDLAFRCLTPDTYKQIASLLDSKRVERETFITNIMTRLQAELNQAGIKGEVQGRPKHIYSIWKKMQGKAIDFAQLYDVRAFRIMVEDVKDCYAALGIVHHIWQPIPKEFDDYIARPKPNGYQSLHTVVMDADNISFEVQVRTHEMSHCLGQTIDCLERRRLGSTQRARARRSNLCAHTLGSSCAFTTRCHTD
jgi:GTP pyrophosphokinase